MLVTLVLSVIAVVHEISENNKPNEVSNFDLYKEFPQVKTWACRILNYQQASTSDEVHVVVANPDTLLASSVKVTGIHS